MKIKLDESKNIPILLSSDLAKIKRKCVESPQYTPTFLLDMGLPGLAIARSLGRRGIPVFALDTKSDHWSHATKYATIICSRLLSDRNSMLSVLKQIHDAIGIKMLLIPLHDGYVQFISDGKNELKEIALFPVQSSQAVSTLVDKYGTYRMCQHNKIPAPWTITINNYQELEKALGNIQYPCLIKPAESRSWQSDAAWELLHGKKIIIVNSTEELTGWYKQLMQLDARLILQEYIPGPGSNLVYAVTYVNHTGNHSGIFVGRKHRMFPLDGGRGCYVESIDDNAAKIVAENVINMLGYKGNIGIELKYDPRDHTYKLIEINARFGLWDGFAADCGLDVIFAAYCDLTGKKFEPVDNYKIGKFWINPEQDIWAGIQSIRLGRLSVLSWLRSWIKPHFSAVSVADDRWPGIMFWKAMSFNLFKKVIHKIKL